VVSRSPPVGIDLVVLVDPLVAVHVVLGEIAEAVAAFRAEQLVAVIDLAVVVAVQREEAAAGRDERDAVLLAVGVDVEGEFGVGELRGGVVEVDDQRVLAHSIAGAHGEVGLRIVLAAHHELQVEADFAAIAGLDGALRREAGLLRLVAGLAIVVFQAPTGTLLLRRELAGRLRLVDLLLGFFIELQVFRLDQAHLEAGHEFHHAQDELHLGIVLGGFEAVPDGFGFVALRDLGGIGNGHQHGRLDAVARARFAFEVGALAALPEAQGLAHAVLLNAGVLAFEGDG
jgi:hypothetical protein